MRKQWVNEPAIPAADLARLTAAGYPPLVAQLLYARRVVEPQDAADFLAGEIRDSDDPLKLTGMAAALDRTRHAVRRGERIVIYGDYDTDGVTATALLVQVLQALGGEAQPYIPDREEEGYGLNVEALRRIRSEAGAALVISVDCGVRSLAEAEAARALGLDLIITDHHEPGDELPRALAIINPKQDKAYPYQNLAGVGLAYKLAQGLVRGWPPPAPINGSAVLDLVALGTVADMAPLTGENRKLVRQGLSVINGQRLVRPGLRALLETAGLKLGRVDAGSIGFALGPRLNAAGRLESALAAYELLATRDGGTASVRAAQLDDQNRQRQALTRETHERARALTAAARPEAPLLFAADPDFREGVVGLAAARLMEEFYRPAVVARLGPETTKGSARSIREFHITAALDACRELLEKHGGHAAAAGFTARSAVVPELKERLEARAAAELGHRNLRPTLRIDADEVSLNSLTYEMWTWLQRFEPCGYGNPAPVLASRAVRVLSERLVGKDSRHLKLTVTDGKARFDAIAFGQGHWCGKLSGAVDLAYSVEMNEWNGERRLQLNVKAVQPSGPG